MPANQIFQFRVALDDFTPKIWRVFEINADASFVYFLQVLLILFRMDGSHLYELTFRPKKLGLKQIEYKTGFYGEDSHSINDFKKLNRVFTETGDKFKFTYDFGDNWRLIGSLKKIYVDPNRKKDDPPRILKGFGYGIIEDCGGTMGLEQMVMASQGEECGLEPDFYADYLEGGFKIENFDLAEENQRLKNALAYRFGLSSKVDED
ncbi:MAG: plasmid pRiA4b ORF-3 family protein [Deltaproteobacteria bacterium]|jgi:hypothetical protein|nr:plasmid pRiA4b ORF-3 family protein [Deltaproteobacteria bacterium]